MRSYVATYLLPYLSKDLALLTSCYLILPTFHKICDYQEEITGMASPQNLLYIAFSRKWLNLQTGQTCETQHLMHSNWVMEHNYCVKSVGSVKFHGTRAYSKFFDRRIEGNGNVCFVKPFYVCWNEDQIVYCHEDHRTSHHKLEWSGLHGANKRWERVEIVPNHLIVELVPHSEEMVLLRFYDLLSSKDKLCLIEECNIPLSEWKIRQDGQCYLFYHEELYCAINKSLFKLTL